MPSAGAKVPPSRGEPLRASVVIPSYNRLEQLLDCLGALKCQTVRDFEIVVVDDGSTDGTQEQLERLQLQCTQPQLRWFGSEGNQGANHARNWGVRESRAELVAFLDSDCIPEPRWLEVMSAAFTSPEIGAATGLVESPAPTNIYELAHRGTSRVQGSGEAGRIVAGNMCVRRHLLLEFPFEEDLKYGCDEEGLSLRLRRAGYRRLFAPGAVVVHMHRYDRAAFFRGAVVLGRAAAWFVYKYHLTPRLDLLPFLIGYGLLPLALADKAFLAAAILALSCGVVALAYNELARKDKSVAETIRAMPVQLAFYHVKLWNYIRETIRLHLTSHGIERVVVRADRRYGRP